MGTERDVKVSYLIPSYNHAHYIAQTIESVLSQTYKNIEILVCDDCSADDTDSVVRKYVEENGVIYMKNEKHSGIVRSLNRMLERARGEYLGFCASDDWIKPEKVEKQLRFLLRSGKDSVFGPVTKYYEDTGKEEDLYWPNAKTVINKGKVLENFYRTGDGAGLLQSGLFRTDAAKAIGFHPKYKADDLLFEIRFFQAGYTAGYMEEPLAYYRIHSSNTHRDHLYCLNELTLPVYRDFVPEKYRDHMMRIACCNAAIDLADDMEMKESLKLQAKTLRSYPSWTVAKKFAKVDLRYFMKKSGLYRLYWKLAHPKMDYPY